MFGIFYMLYTAVVNGAAKIDEDMDNTNRRSKAKAAGEITYYDHNNQLRLTENDRFVWIKTLNKDKVIVDMYNGKVYKNLSKEREEKKKTEATQIGKTVIRIGNEWQKLNYKDKLWYKCNKVPEYKDIKTGALYRTVWINGMRFYMNVENGAIVRLIDEEKCKNKIYNVSVNDIIRVFNERQEKIKQDERFPDQWWWVSSALYLDGKKVNINDNLEVEEEWR